MRRAVQSARIAGEPVAVPPSIDSLRSTPNALARYYTAFGVSERMLLTGHSHQAWPDVSLEAQQRAWLDAALHVDEKWEVAGEMAKRVGEGFRRIMGGCDGDMVIDQNTHALLVRFLSALPLRERPRIVTTDGEFHSAARQMDRLAEEGIEVVKVPAQPLDAVAERLAAEIDDRTACAVASSVFFRSGLIVPGLEAVAEACALHGAELLVDAYHALNVVPFSLEGFERAFVLGGGYKYCQLGEGNCVLRVPPGCRMRPVVTGWFAAFGELADDSGAAGLVRYGRGAARFAGSTYDPTSNYRGAAVFDFFAERGLSVELLRTVSLHQVGLLADRFRALDLDPEAIDFDADVEPERRGGFLALRAPGAARIAAGLRERGVRVDFRGTTLRMGPAPYLNDAQLIAAVETLGEVVRLNRAPAPEDGTRAASG